VEDPEDVNLFRLTLQIDNAVVTPQQYAHFASRRRRMDVADVRKLSEISARLYSDSITPKAAAGLSRAM